MAQRTLTLTCLLAALGILVGCGSSSAGTTVTETVAATEPAPSTDSSSGISLAEFTAQADAICAEENAKVKPHSEAISEQGEEADTQQELNALAEEFRALAKEVQVGLSRLRALEPPAERAEAIEVMLTTAGAQVVLAESVADALTTGDRSKIESLGEQIKLNQAKYRGLAQGLGFHRCGIR